MVTFAPTAIVSPDRLALPPAVIEVLSVSAPTAVALTSPRLLTGPESVRPPAPADRVTAPEPPVAAVTLPMVRVPASALTPPKASMVAPLAFSVVSIWLGEAAP